MPAARSAPRTRRPATRAARRAALALAVALALAPALPGSAPTAPAGPAPAWDVTAATAPGPSGSPAGFGTDGRVVTDLAGAEDGQDLLLLPDGGTIGVGTAWGTDAGDFLLLAHRPDGTLDPAFGRRGAVTTDIGGGDDVAAAGALQADGRILVAGRSEPPGGRCCRFALARFLPDGRPDPSFGAAGKVFAAFAGDGTDPVAEALAVTVDPDGRILAAGRSGGAFALARFLPDGAPDPAFGTRGLVTTPFPAGGAAVHDLALLPDGRILAAGHTGLTAPGSASDAVLARYLPDGTPDPAFGTGGRTVTDFGDEDSLRGLALRPDGRIVTAGYSGVDFALAGFLADGRPDPAFGRTGLVRTDLGVARAYDLALDPDGRILAAGLADADFAVVRYLPDGRVDTDFGTGGLAGADFGNGSHDEAHAVLVLPDGHVLASGTTGGDHALARFPGSGPVPAAATAPAVRPYRPAPAGTVPRPGPDAVPVAERLGHPAGPAPGPGAAR